MKDQYNNKFSARMRVAILAALLAVSFAQQLEECSSGNLSMSLLRLLVKKFVCLYEIGKVFLFFVVNSVLFVF